MADSGNKIFPGTRDGAIGAADSGRPQPRRERGSRRASRRSNARRKRIARLFRDRRSLGDLMVAREILDPPVSLRK